jgi:FAD/FMN-containing dehydrogenase
VSSLALFAEAVGASGPVTIAGLSTRGGAVSGPRAVTAPSGVRWHQADEMTVCCGAATPVDELQAALADSRQSVALPAGGTVGGALAVGVSGARRLGDGPVRDALLQAEYVSAWGEIVKAGGPTVKNVSGFDLCRLLVGSRGTLGFLGEVILRTRPLPAMSQWFTTETADPFSVFSRLYRPTSVLWDGLRVWALLEGHPSDVREQSTGLQECDAPPVLPSHRTAVRPSMVMSLADPAAGLVGSFVAEVGVGTVHLAPEARLPETLVVARPDRASTLALAMKAEFDPTGRLNPGVDV